MSFLFRKSATRLALLGAVVVGVAIAVLRAPTPEDAAIAVGGAPEIARAGESHHDSPRAASSEKEEGRSAGALVRTDDRTSTSLLPLGLRRVEGTGGQGVHRAVLKDGVWFPVFSPGDALDERGEASASRLAAVPLSITSGSPPPGRTGVPFTFAFAAIGGVPPYRWRASVDGAGGALAIQATTGLLTGRSDVPVSTKLDVFVTDSVGAEDSAHYPLSIVEESALAIVTADLPTGMSGGAYQARLEATGGAPPYFWSASGLEAAGLLLTPNTGELSGTPTADGEHVLPVTVTDQRQTSATATLRFTVSTAESELRIATAELADATADAPYTAPLAAEGGEPPYTWAPTRALPEGLSLDATTGLLTGTPVGAGEFSIAVTLADRLGATNTREWPLRVRNGLEITTTSPLFPASPGLPYQVTFAASGGEPPYRWSVKAGALPAGWTLSADGTLAGIAGPVEGAARLVIEAQDASDRAFEKAFELPVRRGLLVIPSRERAGLAWQPAQIDAALRATGIALAGFVVVRSAGDFPQSPAGGTLVYRGTGSNFVDRNLPTGATVFYTLFAQTTDARVLPYATAVTTILPMTTGRAQPGEAGDPFADRISAFTPLTPGGYGAVFVPGNLTGPPDGRGTYAPASAQTQVASLHARTGAGGSVVVEFTDNIVELGPGADFTIFENVLYVGGQATQRFMEPALVWVALFEGEWFRFPIDVVPPAGGQPINLMDPFYYHRGFAGRNGTTGSDPTDPSVSGGDSFDVNELAIPGLTWIRFIRIQATGDAALTDDFGADPVRHNAGFGALSGAGSSGFDFDAVSAVNY
jgi:hypothetical protein